jgi:hypothetical protein
VASHNPITTLIRTRIRIVINKDYEILAILGLG